MIKNLTYFYKCIKFYTMTNLWIFLDDMAGKLIRYLEWKVLDPMYKDESLNKFRNWYWYNQYKEDKDLKRDDNV